MTLGPSDGDLHELTDAGAWTWMVRAHQPARTRDPCLAVCTCAGRPSSRVGGTSRYRRGLSLRQDGSGLAICRVDLHARQIGMARGCLAQTPVGHCRLAARVLLCSARYIQRARPRQHKSCSSIILCYCQLCGTEPDLLVHSTLYRTPRIVTNLGNDNRVVSGADRWLYEPGRS